MARNSTQLHILKLEISHGNWNNTITYLPSKACLFLFLKIKIGSDRHEISMYSQTKPTVGELIEELEKKTRVPKTNIQLIYKGQKLHFSPDAPLTQFGIFSGSRILMVGEKVNLFNIYL